MTHLADVKGGAADSPVADTIVELWVHPEDDPRLLARLRGDSGTPECGSAERGNSIQRNGQGLHCQLVA